MSVERSPIICPSRKTMTIDTANGFGSSMSGGPCSSASAEPGQDETALPASVVNVDNVGE